MPDTQDIKPVGKLTPLIPKQEIKPVGELKPIDVDRSYLEATGQLTPIKPEKTDSKITQVWGSKPKEESSFGMDLLKDLNAGAAALESGIAKAPGYIYDLIAAPINYVASGRLKDDLLMAPEVGNSKILQEANYGDYDKNHAAKSDYFKGIVEANTNPGSLSRAILEAPKKLQEHLDGIVKADHEDQQAKLGTSVSENFSQGKIKDGFKLLARSATESVPTMAALMLGNASGLTSSESTMLGGAVFGAQKKAELDEKFPDMPEHQKVAVSLLNGLSEGYIENSFGLTKLGSEIGKIFKKEGIEAGKKLAAEGFKDVYLPVIKKYGGNYLEEVGSEMTTQYVQNAIDKYVGGEENKNLFDGVLDAGLVAAGMSGPIVGGAGALELNQVKKGVKAQQEIKEKIIERDAEQGKHALEVAQGGDEAVKNFKDQVKEELNKGNLTPEEADKAITRINAYKEYNDITTTLELPEEKKLEVFDKTFQKQTLETELESLGDPTKLHPLKQGEYAAKEKMANDLQKDINKIILESQVRKEPVLGEKTVNDLEKTEQKQAEKAMPKPGEKSKKASELLEAFKNKYKDKLPTEDTRTFEEIPAHEYNSESFNNRLKHKKTTEWLDKLPEKTAFGKIVERNFSHNGKTNSVLGVDVDGKKLRFASSMMREEGYRGHFRQEQFESEFPQGMDVGMKVEEIPALEEGDKPKKVIKAFRADNGKFIGWMKETTRGTSEYSPAQQDALGHLETIVEPPLDLFNKTVAPPKPPKAPKEPKVKSVKEEYEKPELSLETIKDPSVLKNKLGKEPMRTPKGDVVEVNVTVGKKQAQIESEHARLLKLVDCIWKS